MMVDVVMGGPGREAAVSRTSGKAVSAGLRRKGHDVLEVDLAGELEPQRLRAGAVVFNIIHGTYGEDGKLQSALERLGKAYVGSGVEVSALCMDKDKTKKRLQDAGIRVPWGVRVHLGQAFSPKDLKLPHHGGLVMKPANDGSSVGLRMVANPSFVLPTCEELIKEVGAVPYLIEERLPGPEYTVAIIDEDAGPRALPPLHIVAADGVFDYQAKYHRTDTREDPVTDQALAARLQEIGLAAYKACGCRDLGRVDVMVTADQGLAVLEINTLPGFTGQSLVPKAAAAAGIGFDDLVDRLVRRAASRQGQKGGA
jgi:D-alanine-D-alanine ligase